MRDDSNLDSEPNKVIIFDLVKIRIAHVIIYIINENVSSANHSLRENSCKPRQKSRPNSPKKSHM